MKNLIQADRLLIYENLQEQQRILQEIETRKSILSSLSAAGLNKEEIISITSSIDTIDKYILKKQLEENRYLKQLYDNGIKVTAELPQHLNQISFDLKAWYNYRMPNRQTSKFENLFYGGATWEVDPIGVEKLFTQTHAKVYIDGKSVEEYRTLDIMKEYLEKARCPNNQVVNTTFLNARFECIGQFKFKIRWTYFAS